MNMTYTVRKPVKYNGKQLEVGEKFEPKGGKFDEQIIAEGRLVARERLKRPKPQAKKAQVEDGG